MLNKELENKILNNHYHRAKWFEQREAEVKVIWNDGNIEPKVLVGEVIELIDNGQDRFVVFKASKSSQEFSPVQFTDPIRLNIKDIIEIKEFI